MFKTKKNFVILSALLFVVLGAFAFVFFSPSPPTSASQGGLVAKPVGFTSRESLRDLESLQNAFREIAEEASEAVVNLNIERKVKGGWRIFRGFDEGFFGSPFDDLFRDFFKDTPEREYKQKSLGSGVIYDKSGYIITNNHVVKDATEINVTLLDGREFKGSVVGTDPKTDIALIKVESKEELPEAKLGDSDKVRIGDWAIAIGNPHGLEHTLTVGVVSAKGRAIGVAEYENFIQTDASINPGNSGGPLLNIKGEVIGINTAIIVPAQGIGFAIPINMVKKVIDDLREHKRVIRSWLGVIIQEITQELGEKFGVKPKHGVLVADVFPGSPADSAGIEPGDVILEFDGKRVSSVRQLQQMVLGHSVGETVTLKIKREGKVLKKRTRLAELPEDTEVFARSRRETEAEDLGLRVQDITDDLIERYELHEPARGVVVTDVVPDSPADRAGLREGDVIERIEGRDLMDTKDFRKALKEVKGKDTILFHVRRGRYRIYITLDTGD